MKVETEEGVWEVRKPTAREVMSLANMKEGVTSEENFDVIKGILQKIIITIPDGLADDYLETLPADSFFTLFLEACGSTLDVLGKLS